MLPPIFAYFLSCPFKRSRTKARQIFTLFHELGHLLFNTSGVDFRTHELPPTRDADARRIEVLCNAFAGAILLPDDAFQRELAGRAPSFDTVRELASRFKVSMLVIFRKLRDAEMIDATAYAEAHRRAEEAERDMGGGDIISTREVYREVSGSNVPSLREWAENNQPVFPTPTAAEGAFVQGIFRVTHFQNNIERKKLLNGGYVADPFVIARASIAGATVVSMETFKPNAADLPNICQHFDVQHMSLEQFMQSEGWNF